MLATLLLPLLASMAAALPSATCNTCAASPSLAICQPTCQNPPRDSCDFYKTCAEATLHCGSQGYPIRYGDSNCNKFVKRLGKFTAQGQTWVWDVMSCLQRALVAPLAQCGTTCDALSDAAFASHPVCYVSSGVCDLPLADLVQIVITVNTDLFVGPALQQILGTVKGCIEHYRDEIEGKIGELESRAADDRLRAPEYLAQIAVLEGVQNELER